MFPLPSRTLLCITLLSLLSVCSRCREQRSTPLNTIVSVGSNGTLRCTPLKDPLLWRRERIPNEPIFDGILILNKYRGKFACPVKNGLRDSLMLMDASLEDADKYECVKDEMLGQVFHAVIIVSDHSNIQCEVMVDGVETSQNVVHMQTNQQMSINCSFAYQSTQHCSPTATWKQNVSEEAEEAKVVERWFELRHTASEHSINATRYSLSVSFECISNSSSHATNKPQLKDIYLSPTFYFLPHADWSTEAVTSDPHTRPVHTFDFSETSVHEDISTINPSIHPSLIHHASMTTTMIITACLFIIVFFVFFTYIFVSRRKSTQRHSLIDYMRSTPRPLDSQHCPSSNLLMSENIAFKRHATCQENSYIQNHSPSTTTTTCPTLSSSRHNILHRLQSQPNAQHPISSQYSLQGQMFPTPSHYPPFQDGPSMSYQPLIHSTPAPQPNNTQSTFDDFYDTIPDYEAYPEAQNLPHKPLTTTNKTSPPSTPPTPTTANDYLLEKPKDINQPEPTSPNHPPPSLAPSESNLGVYLFPENKAD